jgi:hypothetical protein
MLLTLCAVLSGCIQQPIDETRFFSYNQTKLGQSSSGDVLNYIDMSLTTLISKSDTVIASWGQEKDGYQQWLNLVAFDEQTADATRKYFFFVDEKARRIPFVFQWAADFDAELILDKTVLEKPYADEKVRDIAILAEIGKRFDDDISKTESDNKNLSMCKMIMKESFEQALMQLNDSPAWTAKLDTPDGWTFDSRNFSTGNIKMHEEGDRVTIRMQLGAIPWYKAKSEPGKPYDPNDPQN